MKVLGIHDGHNAAACLLSDGRIVQAVQEERLRREKNFAGFPTQSVDMILESSGLSVDQLEASQLQPPKCRTKTPEIAEWPCIDESPPKADLKKVLRWKLA